MAKSNKRYKAPVRTFIGRCPVTNKRQYVTEAHAKAEAKQFRKRKGPKLRAYICSYCWLWHNGHNRKPENRGPSPMAKPNLNYNKNRRTIKSEVDSKEPKARVSQER